jgi:hypothetical protein
VSLFKTIIPVDLEAIKKLLPKESSVDSVKFDPATNAVELHWHARYVSVPPQRLSPRQKPICQRRLLSPQNPQNVQSVQNRVDSP